MTRHLLAYVAAAIVLFALDMVWLRLIAFDWYQQGIGHLMAGRINAVAGGLFYLLYPIGLLLFAMMPGSDVALPRVALLGALFGLFAYGTYDMTNLATLKGWPVGLSLLDMGWGALASGVSALAGRAAANAF